MRHYAITMGIRTVCFILMAVVAPVGWWTFVFAAGAVFLPYIAVVYANAGSDSTPQTIESPVLQVEASSSEMATQERTQQVITVHERPRTDTGVDAP
ncbi:hypothetical protein GCM10022383_27960 [Microbacterium soli]|uniref:DUF3099 domain-containing protein n=1 Tax=Microbacterium soli TaxID=446075 RepID=A0ABP7NJI5_9MICO